MHKKKTIGIDARMYGPSCKGLGRYVEEIVKGVCEDRDFDFVVFMSKDNIDSFAPSGSNVRKVLADARWYTLKEQLLMPYLIYKEGIDLVHFPHFNVPFFCTAQFVVTIHDLILTKYPSMRATTLSPTLYRIKYQMYKLVIKRALKGSKAIIAVSKFTKDDVIEQFDIDSSKITVTYEGVSDKIKKNNVSSEEVLQKYRVKKPFVMYVGNAYPHKNLEGLIDEYKIYTSPDKPQLVLVGGEDYFYKRLRSKVDSENIKGVSFLGYVPDGDLAHLYSEAWAYVFPSMYEGFGLPPLEAMKHSCPVLSSDKSCMPEILGGAAWYFDPDEPGWLGMSLEKLKNSQIKEKKVQRGALQVKKYNWAKCVEKTLDIYKNIT